MARQTANRTALGAATCRTRYIDDRVFGLEPSDIPDFLKPYHLAVIADVGNWHYQEKYLKPTGRNLVVFEGERIVQATVN